MSLFERVIEKFIDIIDSDNTFYFMIIWFFATMLFQLIRIL